MSLRDNDGMHHHWSTRIYKPTRVENKKVGALKKILITRLIGSTEEVVLNTIPMGTTTTTINRLVHRAKPCNLSSITDNFSHQDKGIKPNSLLSTPGSQGIKTITGLMSFYNLKNQTFPA